MNIDLSQIIWTVICFALFALVLDRLLIRPVLANIDRRRSKIESARGRKAEIDEARRSAEETASEKSAQRRELASKEREAALAAASADADAALEALAAELKSR